MKLKKIRIRLLSLIFAVFILFVYTATVSAAEFLEKLRISTVDVISLNVNETYTFLQEYVSSDETIFSIDGKTGTALKEGDVYLTLSGKKEKKYIIKIEAFYDYVTIETESGSLMIDKGETVKLKATVSPVTLKQTVTWKSTDESVATIDANGLVTAKDYGITTIVATSTEDNTCVGETIVLVDDDSLENFEDVVETKEGEPEIVKIDASNLQSVLMTLIDQAGKSVVGVEKYQYVKSYFSKSLESVDFGSGIVYKRDAVLTNGSVIKDVDDVSDTQNFSTFRYYVISSRHVVQNADQLKIYLGEDINECEAELIQYDDKIDLSVLTFETTTYIPTIKLGDSDTINRGEFIIAIGNGYGKNYFRSSTFGVISYTKRYVATDTDGDEISDWDSEYIQHDASINSQSSGSTNTNSGGNGGALINLKGELIGINSTKISATTIDNMSFAVPSNLAFEIAAMLEQGIKPERPILGVEIVDVSRYYQNKEYYNYNYPNMEKVLGDTNLEYGFYVNKITEGGLASIAGVEIGDILLEFNGVNTKYSYMLRAELGKFMYGSGQTADLKVLRNGVEITLTVTF